MTLDDHPVHDGECSHENTDTIEANGKTLTKWVKWTRTIEVEGPIKWIERTMNSSLIDGVHEAGEGRIRVKTSSVDTDTLYSPMVTITDARKINEDHIREHMAADPEHAADYAALLGIEFEESEKQPKRQRESNPGGYI